MDDVYAGPYGKYRGMVSGFRTLSSNYDIYCTHGANSFAACFHFIGEGMILIEFESQSLAECAKVLRQIADQLDSGEMCGPIIGDAGDAKGSWIVYEPPNYEWTTTLPFITREKILYSVDKQQ